MPVGVCLVGELFATYVINMNVRRIDRFNYSSHLLHIQLLIKTKVEKYITFIYRPTGRF